MYLSLRGSELKKMNDQPGNIIMNASSSLQQPDESAGVLIFMSKDYCQINRLV